jgi:hypothetical protein
MTYAKLLGFGGLLTGVLLMFKALFYARFDWSGSFVLHLFYLGLVVVLAAALVRRLGVITMLEALVVAILWFVMDLLATGLIAAPLAGWKMLIDLYIILGLLFVPLSVIAFHKKRHIERRKELAAK